MDRSCCERFEGGDRSVELCEEATHAGAVFTGAERRNEGSVVPECPLFAAAEAPPHFVAEVAIVDENRPNVVKLVGRRHEPLVRGRLLRVGYVCLFACAPRWLLGSLRHLRIAAAADDVVNGSAIAAEDLGAGFD